MCEANYHPHNPDFLPSIVLILLMYLSQVKPVCSADVKPAGLGEPHSFCKPQFILSHGNMSKVMNRKSSGKGLGESHRKGWPFFSPCTVSGLDVTSCPSGVLLSLTREGSLQWEGHNGDTEKTKSFVNDWRLSQPHLKSSPTWDFSYVKWSFSHYLKLGGGSICLYSQLFRRQRQENHSLRSLKLWGEPFISNP